MLPLSLSQALALFTWFPLAALLFFLLLIARAYSKFCGQRTYYRLYLAPIFLFGAGAVRSAGHGQLDHDPLTALLFAAGGLVLLGLIILLYRLMILSRLPIRKP